MITPGNLAIPRPGPPRPFSTWNMLVLLILHLQEGRYYENIQYALGALCCKFNPTFLIVTGDQYAREI